MSSTPDRTDIQRAVASHWANKFDRKEVPTRPSSDKCLGIETNDDDIIDLETTSDEEIEELELTEPPLKKSKTQEEVLSIPIFNSSKLLVPSPVHVFKTKALNPPNTDSILSIFSSKLLKETYIFSFELDVGFVLSGMHDPDNTKIHIISQHIVPLKIMPSNIHIVNVNSIRKTQWCFHHSKLVINFYKDDTMQVVVSTSNFIPTDDEFLGGVYWKSDLLLPNSQSVGKQDFKIDLCSYLSAYGKPQILLLIDKIKIYDFSDVKASFIGSVPGLSRGDFGYLRLLHHLKQRKLIPKIDKYKRFKFLAQVSSIAGPFKTQNGEVSNILTHLLLPLVLGQKFPLQPGEAALNNFIQGHDFEIKPIILFPTKEEIFASANINGGSGSLIYNNLTKPGSIQDKYLSKHFYKRNPIETNSIFVNNHSKIYLLTEDDFETLNWCFIGSMNLSKSAWGTPTKDGELRGGHWECGVLLDPKDYNSNGKFVPVFNENMSYGQNTAIRLPFKLPVYKYQQGDKAWCRFDPNMLTQVI